ncbi:hypothetical protein COOONC_12864 [Cooperia oncophora]
MQRLVVAAVLLLAATKHSALQRQKTPSFQFSDKYDKAIICSFHSPRGIVARVNYPDPIVIQPFIDATEPEGHTDTTYTQCSTNVSQSAPTKAKFKLISGKWESEP